MTGAAFFRALAPAILLTMASLATATFAPRASAAEGRMAPASGPVLLEISGNISTSNATNARDEAVLKLDRDAILALPQATIDTHTGWTDGIQQFEGVRLVALLDHAGADGSLITAIALNDYRADIPISDLSEHDILVAHTWNGERMRVRDRGPLWIIYPSGPEVTSQPSLRNSKMVWQLEKLEISE